MTQIGKCNTCRQRKVKCDEARPKCGPCRKKDRPCTYTYGKASAVVIQDPSQLTKHGKSKVEPIVHNFGPLVQSEDISSSGISDLRLTSERQAENEQGFFSTLAPISKPQSRPSKKKEAYQKRILETYLQEIQEKSALVSMRPLSHEGNLIARYIDMLGPNSAGRQPLSILGTWIQSIPSRIGSSRLLDLAVEFFVNSHAVYVDDTYSKRKLVRSTKAVALRELQLAMLSNSNKPSYEILLATKMHYAAEALIGIESMYHAIHAFGLAELLKSGMVSNIDEEHYWNLIDNTYADDVNEALLAGRKSVYDNEFYLASTYLHAIEPGNVPIPTLQRASMVVMHIFIQCPRLVCLVRQAVINRADTTALASAISLAESLWQIDLPGQVQGHINASVTINPTPVDPEMVDILPDSLEFDTVQSMNLCTRYWSLRIVLSGLADTLCRHFPLEYSMSWLPSPATIRDIDIDAAVQMAKSLHWADSVSASLPLVPLRLHSSLQFSIGPWNRLVRNLASIKPGRETTDFQSSVSEISRAERMKTWLFEECNRIHAPWHVSKVEEIPLLQAIDTMAGEKIPEWLPVRVRFEAEDGNMVLRLDYESHTGNYQERYELGEQQFPKKVSTFRDGVQLPSRVTDRQELPHRPAKCLSLTDQSGAQGSNTTLANSQLPNMRPVDMIYSTGRNICSISGSWPNTSSTVRVPLDSEQNASGPTEPYCVPNSCISDLTSQEENNGHDPTIHWQSHELVNVTGLSSSSNAADIFPLPESWDDREPDYGSEYTRESHKDHFST